MYHLQSETIEKTLLHSEDLFDVYQTQEEVPMWDSTECGILYSKFSILELNPFIVTSWFPLER